jgi:hypothetical protein
MTLQEVAEKMYPTNKKGSMWMPNRDEVNNQYRQEGFIAGVTSKYAEKEKLEFAIAHLYEFRKSTFGKGINVIKKLEEQLKNLNL